VKHPKLRYENAPDWAVVPEGLKGFQGLPRYHNYVIVSINGLWWRTATEGEMETIRQGVTPFGAARLALPYRSEN
jgi:hypothetical protein